MRTSRWARAVGCTGRGAHQSRGTAPWGEPHPWLAHNTGTPELGEIRKTTGVRTVSNAFGMTVYLITRHDDVKEVLSDHERFSNGRPPGFVLTGAPKLSEDELARSRAGNLLALDPPKHQRLRRMLTPEFTIRRMKRLQARIVEIVDKARTVGPEEQVKLSQELYRIWAENLYEIGTVGLTPMVQGVVVTNTKFRNVPTTLGNDWPLRSPGNARTEQFYFTK